MAAEPQIVHSSTQRQPATTHEFFVANLTDMFVGAVSPPVSPTSGEAGRIAEEHA